MTGLQVRHPATWALLVLVGISVAPTRAMDQMTMGQTSVEGLTEPFRAIEVAAPEPGIVTRVAVREGTLVKQGQVLASLDNEVHIATLAVAQKNMEAVGGLNSA